ncbi:MAG: ribonuclease [Xanthomonadales bacterium]|nr:ribonuclease [Xanthomonadales bacterium]ODU92716.1 MAG: ribonuclease [Rhodanobacter sp. SCN 66-43]OJY83920.1 MAG: ribonuclease [Xanthomonadales bacterium 66-474]
MQRGWKTLLPVAVLIAVIGYMVMQQRATRVPVPSPTATVAPAPDEASDDTDAQASLPAFLPPEARHTLALIASGGPFPHSQDGVVFGNYEHLLPNKPRGYYHEYTVETPGAHDRGARRIITGGDPPGVYYYTDDHYRSFREFTVSR